MECEFKTGMPEVEGELKEEAWEGYVLSSKWRDMKEEATGIAHGHTSHN